MPEKKLWTKEFISISLISFFLFLSFNILFNVLPLYLVGVLHTGTDEVGMVVSVFMIAAILSRPFVGLWLKRFPLKKLLILSSLAYLGVTLLYPIVQSFVVLLLLRFLHGICFGIITTITSTILTLIVPVQRRGEGLGYYSMSLSLTMVFGPYIAISLANRNAYTLAFILIGLIVFLETALTFVMKVPEQQHTLQGAPHGPSKISLQDLYDKKALPFALTTFLLACCSSSISAFLALYTKSLGLAETAGYFFLCYSSFVILSRTFSGRMADRMGPRIVVMPSMLLFAAGLLLLSQTHTSLHLLVAAGVLGLGYGAMTPIIQMQTINAVGQSRIVVANSLHFNMLDAGMAMGAYSMGLLAGNTSYSNGYLLAAVVATLAGALFFLFSGKKKAHVPQEKVVG